MVSDEDVAAYDAHYARLLEFCGTKLITVTLYDCSLLDVLEYVTRDIGASYAFEEDAIVIKGPDESILHRLRKSESANKSLGDTVAESSERQ